jgi:predicted house-cleaning noncanonical NTP pyrophosphatase (MazG superfamily)
MKEIRLTTVTISHENGTYSATQQNIVDIADMMELIRGVLLNVGFSAENIEEYIPAR